MYARARRARERGLQERNIKTSVSFFPHPYPFALAVNKSPAVYFLSRMLDGGENRGSVNRLLETEITKPY